MRVYEYRARVSASQSANPLTNVAASQLRNRAPVADCNATLQNHAVQILFVSHSHDDGVFKVGSHHLVRELARLGFAVAHVSTPYSTAHALLSRRGRERNRLARAGVRVDASGVKHLIPKTILPAQFSSPAYLSRAFEAVGMRRPQLVFVDQPLMLCDAIFELGAVTVYRPTDLYLHGSAQRLQSKYVRRFDAVAATSTEVLARLPPADSQPRTVIPNGVEYSRFLATDTAAPRSGAVYVGAIDSRFDWAAVVSMARAFPDLEISLVGPVSSPPPDLPASVHLRGPMSYQDVPGYLALFSVGLLPLSADPSNSGRSPMKLFEYLAAGLYVVATGVSGLTSRNDLPGCCFYSGPADAPGGLERALANHGPNTAGMESARAQDWREKAKQLLRFAQATRLPQSDTHGVDRVAK